MSLLRCLESAFADVDSIIVDARTLFLDFAIRYSSSDGKGKQSTWAGRVFEEAFGTSTPVGSVSEGASARCRLYEQIFMKLDNVGDGKSSHFDGEAGGQ